MHHWLNVESEVINCQGGLTLKYVALAVKETISWSNFKLTKILVHGVPTKKWRNRTVHIIKKSKEDYYSIRTFWLIIYITLINYGKS